MSQMSQTRFWHQLTREQQEKVLNSDMTIQEFMRKYKQPWWCDYPEALCGTLGCWGLIHPNRHERCSPKDCQGCDCCRGTPEWAEAIDPSIRLSTGCMTFNDHRPEKLNHEHV